VSLPTLFCKADRLPGSRRRASAFLLALLGALLAGRVLAQPADQPVPEEVPPVDLTYDFRGSKPLPPGFRLAGALHELTARPEEEGFRLSLAGKQPNGIGRAGLEMKTTLRGDFSITAAYEILKAEPPTQGHGVGFEMYAHTVHVPQQGFGVYRMERIDEGDVYHVSRSYLNEDGKLAWRARSFPTAAKAGRLRITRSGTEVTAWAAEGKSPLFKELSRDDLGRDDIKVIWLMAYTGHVSHALELRLTDLEIRSGVPVPAPPPAEAAPTPVSRPHLWWALGVLVMLLVIGVAILLRYARRRRIQTESSES
jgi:hypothetical protein